MLEEKEVMGKTKGELFPQDRLHKVNSILVSQPKPTDQSSPYFALAKKYKVKIDFRPFIQIEPVTIKEFSRNLGT